MPECDGLWEINKGKKLSGDLLFRLYFFEHKGDLIFVDYLHGKKSNKTPKNKKENVIANMQEYRRRNP